MHMYVKNGMNGMNVTDLYQDPSSRYLILGFQCFCVKLSSQIDICHSETCLSTSFDSCFIVTPLCSFVFFV